MTRDVLSSIGCYQSKFYLPPRDDLATLDSFPLLLVVSGEWTLQSSTEIPLENVASILLVSELICCICRDLKQNGRLTQCADL